jgi:hypothetical protein
MYSKKQEESVMIIIIKNDPVINGETLEKIKKYIGGFSPHVGGKISFVGDLRKGIVFRTPVKRLRMAETTRIWIRRTLDQLGVKNEFAISAK